MTDIVWSLRNDVRCSGDIGCADELCNKAADEIERLRQILENIQQARVLQGKAIIDASDEIERLRAALHRISLGLQNSGTIKEDLGREARAALEGK